jgi:AcrR family transcriptional regulator
MTTRSRTRRSATRISRKGEARRLQILATAKRLLLEGGPGAVVLRDVAEELRMTHSNIQYYFPTWDHLVVAIYDDEIQKYMGSVDVEVDANDLKSALARLDEIVDAGLKLVRSPDTALWRLMVGMLDHNPAMSALHLKESRRYEDRLVVALGVLVPRLSTARRRAVAILIQAVIDGMSIRAVHEKTPGAATRRVDEEVRRAVRLLVEFAPESGPAGPRGAR